MGIEQLDIGSTSLYTESASPSFPPKLRQDRALPDEELYAEFVASGLTREAFAKKMGMSRTTLWRKFSTFEKQE